MGSSQSQFEERFSHNYCFIQLTEHPLLGRVKIHRKVHENYDYVMVIDKRVGELRDSSLMGCIKPECDKSSPSRASRKMIYDGRGSEVPSFLDHDHTERSHSVKLQKLKHTLELIKRYQDSSAVTLLNYQMINQSKIQCKESVIRLFMEYQNHYLLEYLEVLRQSKYALQLGEVLYVLKTLCKALLNLKNMSIEVKFSDITVRNIIVTFEGQVKFNPIDVLFRRELEHGQQSQLKLGKALNYVKVKPEKIADCQFGSKREYSDTNYGFSNSSSGFGLREQDILLKVYLDLTSYMAQRQLIQHQNLKHIIQNSKGIGSLYDTLSAYAPSEDELLVLKIYGLEEEQSGHQTDQIHKPQQRSTIPPKQYSQYQKV